MAGNANSGRKKGSRNKRTFAQRIAREYELEPLTYMLDIMNDKKQEQSARMDAAKSAAPYIHAKLSHKEVDFKGEWDGDPNSITNEMLAGIIQTATSK